MVTAHVPVTVVANPAVGATWVPAAGSPGLDWGDPANWNPAVIPNGVGSTASMNIDIAGDQVVKLTGPVTVGELVVGDSEGAQATLLQDATGGLLVFDQTASAAAYLTRTAGAPAP